jgi:DNA-binding NarL/FixJ family response regulator
MPGGGAYAARSIREASPHTCCVAFSACCDQESVKAMREAGVSKYLVKGAASVADIIRAIEHAADQGEACPTT